MAFSCLPWARATALSTKSSDAEWIRRWSSEEQPDEFRRDTPFPLRLNGHTDHYQQKAEAKTSALTWTPRWIHLDKLLLVFFSFSGILARDQKPAAHSRWQCSFAWQAISFKGTIRR